MPQVCDAARAGLASLRSSFGRFDISFIGTGTAVLPDNIDFNDLKTGDDMQMRWTTNRFIGQHWLLGKFNIELNPEKTSIGKLENIQFSNNRNQALNTNEFYFKFTFPRLNNMVIFNNEPIVNSSIVFDIPPTPESVYKLNEESKNLSGTLPNKKSINITFNFCDISLFPERNISLDISGVTKIDSKHFKVSAKYTNLTDRKAKCAFFLVLHDKDLITQNDYGFRTVRGGQSFTIDYIVSHKLENVKVDLPIFGGLYLPEELRGSTNKTVTLQF